MFVVGVVVLMSIVGCRKIDLGFFKTYEDPVSAVIDGTYYECPPRSMTPHQHAMTNPRLFLYDDSFEFGLTSPLQSGDSEVKLMLRVICYEPFERGKRYSVFPEVLRPGDRYLGGLSGYLDGLCEPVSGWVEFTELNMNDRYKYVTGRFELNCGDEQFVVEVRDGKFGSMRVDVYDRRSDDVLEAN